MGLQRELSIFLRYLLVAVVPVFTAVAVGEQPQAGPLQVPPGTHELLQSMNNAQLTQRDGHFDMRRTSPAQPMHATFTHCLLFGVRKEQGQWWILPASENTTVITANTSLWILPISPDSDASSLLLDLGNHSAIARIHEHQADLDIDADAITMSPFESRPHSDAFGNRFSISIGGDHTLESTLAAFYWGTMLPLVVEKTMAASFPYHDGYVLSTLNTAAYAGTYPAVDHEFQIAGRLAMGSPLDSDVVRRMIELQFAVMRDDPEGLFRDPCSVQPDGRREYHIRRDSRDARENAAMFPLTGNIEIVEESWHFYEMSGSKPWLRAHIQDLEDAAHWTLAHTDPYGRVWSDVYYEDQVIKDGRETEAQAFAAHLFDLLSRMEATLGRPSKSIHYQQIATSMKQALIKPLPLGYWDATHERFVDWVDRNGVPHDHVHLVANTAPVTFGYATTQQAGAVGGLIAANQGNFERFPSFVAAHVEDYSPSEMGVAGPYDLSAAGRYWYWDAAYRSSQQDGSALLKQLNLVAAEAAKSGYFMSERYDMDHVYYVDGKDAHGAEKYFEYPNVFTAVLISDLLGISKTAEADLAIQPRLPRFGEVELDTPAYEVKYIYNASGFTLTNLASKERSFAVNLSAIASSSMRLLRNRDRTTDAHGTYHLRLAPGETVKWTNTAN